MTRRRIKGLFPPSAGGVAVTGIAVVALTAGVLAFGARDAYPTTQVVQPSGLAWVASDQIGSLTLLDGVAGQPVVDVPVARADGDPLLAGQSGTTGFALDQATGRLTRIDGSTYATSATQNPPAGTGSGADTELLTGTHTAYVVDGSGHTVSVYDLATLRLLSGPTAFTGHSSHYTAVVDSSDRLWVLDQGTGRLGWFSTAADGRAPGTFAAGAALVLAGGEPVVADAKARSAALIAPDGSVRTRLELGINSGSGSGVRVTGAPAQRSVLVTDSTLGVYQVCDLDLGMCGVPRHAAFAGDALGPAVTADGRVFVSDYSTGTVWVLDPGGTAAPVHTGALTTAGPFDLFDSNGLVFYNDPHSARAGTIAADGTPRPIAKYSTAAAPGTSRASGAPSTSASPTGTVAAPTASTPPTQTAPTLSTLTPVRPSSSGAGPSLTPSPSPDPTPTGPGGSTPSCSSASPSPASSPLSSDQGGIALRNSDRSVQNLLPGEKGREPWSPTKTQIVVAVIGALGAIAAAVIPILIVHYSDQAPSPSNSTAPLAGHTSSPAASPLAPASGGPIPTTPEAVIQDPGGTGVYGVAFTSNSTFATGDSNGSAYLWSIGNGTSTKTLPDQSGQAIFGIAYGPHGNILAANTSNAPHYTTGSVVLWDATSGKYTTTLKNPGTGGVGSPVAFSPDGKTLAASDANGGIYLWSTANDKPAGTLNGASTEPNYEIAYSPATGYLAAANGNGTAYLWNTQTESIVTSFPDPDSQGVRSIAFSPDGSLLATGDDNGNVYLWNVADHTRVTLPGLNGGKVESIAFSPRVGALAATLNNDNAKKSEFCVWNTAGKLLATRTDSGSTGGTKVAFSPDGNLLVVGDTNDSTYIWNVAGLN